METKPTPKNWTTNYDARPTDFHEGQTVWYKLAVGDKMAKGRIGTISGDTVLMDSGDWCYVWDIEQ